MSEHNKKIPDTIVPDLLTIADVMEKLKISRTTLHEMTKTGTIKSCKIGGSVRYNPEDINHFINSNAASEVAQASK